MGITLKQAQVFLATARTEHLGKAAQRLYMTKGAVSQALREFENQLGVHLFDRNHPRILLNHEGRRLLPLADELVGRAAELEHFFRGDNGAADDFLLAGCSKTIGNYLMPGLIAGFETRHGWLPDVHIANSGEILRLIASFTLDMALLEGEERHPDLTFEPWLEDDMVVIAPSSHPLANGVRHTVDRLASERWILREQDSGTREYFANTLGAALGRYTIALTLGSPAAIMEAVAQGLGVTFASRFCTGHFPQTERFSVIELERSFPRIFSLCYHSRKYHAAGMRAFLDFCRERKESGKAGVN